MTKIPEGKYCEHYAEEANKEKTPWCIFKEKTPWCIFVEPAIKLKRDKNGNVLVGEKCPCLKRGVK